MLVDYTIPGVKSRSDMKVAAGVVFRHEDIHISIIYIEESRLDADELPEHLTRYVLVCGAASAVSGASQQLH